jgi:hypothetical protein
LRGLLRLRIVPTDEGFAMTDDTIREAACACGELRIRLVGEPAMVSTCCCQACQRRTGSFFGVTAFFRQDQVTGQDGTPRDFTRIAESGNALDFHFCAACGSTVWWEPHARPGMVAVAAGAFADVSFPQPERMIWTEHRHPWVCTPDDLPLFDHAP